MRKIPALIALLCILAYVAALVFGAYRVYTSIEGRRRTAARELDEIKALVSRNGPAFLEPSFRDQIRAKVEQSAVLEGIIVTGSQGGDLVFEKETVVKWDGQIPRFQGGFGLVSSAVPVDVSGLRNVNIHSLVNVIDYSHLIQVLKEALLVIILALALVFFTLIAQALTRARTNGDFEREPDSPDVSRDPSLKNAPPEQTSSNDFNLDIPPVPDIPDIPDIPAPPEERGEDDFALGDFLNEDDLDLPDFDDYKEDSGREYDLPAPEDDAPGDGSGPSGLYSPRSGIGWEAYTHDRLASELHRCAASEQDLVVLLMECAADCGEDFYKKLSGEAVQFFNMKDLSFERGTNGICIILPNIDLDQAMSRAEEFHEAFRAGVGHPKNDFSMGLSSRAGRLIDGNRLFFEAANALQKAIDGDDSPIVAFRSDPEKYREFIKKGRT
ncbi:MAG: hypothetical protein LBJ31_11045 [Treponema sp.]|jgi:hypothetical protein|nr:hypothetical protein [Treponema sp.]